MKFKDIKQFPHSSYWVTVYWSYLKQHIQDHYDASGSYDTNLDPPYQRDHVWTQEQKTQYIEYCLRGGSSGRDIFFNCPGWMNWGRYMKDTGIKPTLELVDGKQRMNAVLEFLDDKVLVFGGHKLSDFEDKPRHESAYFKIHVNSLEDKKEVLEWYIGMNTGGTAHTEEDLRTAYEELKKIS